MSIHTNTTSNIQSLVDKAVLDQQTATDSIDACKHLWLTGQAPAELDAAIEYSSNALVEIKALQSKVHGG